MWVPERGRASQTAQTSQFVKSEQYGHIFTWTLENSFSELRRSFNLILFLWYSTFAKVSSKYWSYSSILPQSTRKSNASNYKILKIRISMILLFMWIFSRLLSLTSNFRGDGGRIELWNQNPIETLMKVDKHRKRIKLKLLLSSENEFSKSSM